MSPEISNRPSKQFIKRGLVAVGILSVVLIVQTNWFHKLVLHKEKKVLVSQTVGDIVARDSNDNGIEDWEEKLWGLDPTVLYTNGTPNAEIIANKKKSLGIQNNTNTEPLDDTDRLARELFTLTTALGQSDEVDSQTLAEIASKLGSSIEIKGAQNQYSLKDVQTTPTNLQTLATYKNSLQKTLSKYNTQVPEIEVLVTALQNEDPSGLPQLGQNAIMYTQVAKDLISIKVPVGLAQDHLALVNSFAGISTSFTYMTELNDNSIVALVGVAIYKNYSAKLSTTSTAINAYLTQYGIL